MFQVLLRILMCSKENNVTRLANTLLMRLKDPLKWNMNNELYQSCILGRQVMDESQHVSSYWCSRFKARTKAKKRL